MPGRSLGATDAAAFGANPVNVNFNVISARKTATDNLLDCYALDDAVYVPREKPVVVTYRLIAES